MESPSFMKNGRFHPPKYRDKVQKMGVMCTHSLKMPGPSLDNSKTKKKKIGKKEGCRLIGPHLLASLGRVP
jgi:hypothetical protein